MTPKILWGLFDSDQVLTADTSGAVCIWDASSGEKKLTIADAHGAAGLSFAAFSTHDSRMVTGVRLLSSWSMCLRVGWQQKHYGRATSMSNLFPLCVRKVIVPECIA